MNANENLTNDETIEARASCIEHAEAMLEDLKRIGEDYLAEKLQVKLHEWRIDEDRASTGW
jgi:hypothetical protein